MRIIEETILSDSKIKYVLKNKLHFSSALLTKIKNNGEVFLNGNVARLSDEAKTGDVLRVVIPTLLSSGIEPEQASLEILYEDEDVICINKPRGIPSHPSQGHRSGTLANFAVYHLKDTNDEFHIVTRLDNYTSGIVLAAKNAFSAAIMCTKEYNSTLKKEYVALCRGVFDAKSGIIEAPIARCDNSIIKRMVRSDGKYAKTEFEVIGENNNISLLKLILHTGRTHQIRVHMSHIGHPLVNDFLYDDNAEDGKMFSLHCKKISFVHPYTKKDIEVVAPLPEYFML